MHVKEKKYITILMGVLVIPIMLLASPGFVDAASPVKPAANKGGKDAAINRMYRYKDANGQIVIDDSIPPELARNGYEVLNSVGQVLEIVPRQLTAAEIANLSDEEKAKRAAKENEKRQQAYDESLLLRYSDVTDIEAARERSIKELQIRMSILRGNMMQVKANLEREQQRAADIERSGREVSKDIRNSINQLRKTIELSESDIELRKREIEEVRDQYQKEIERFRYLTDVKGYRR